MSGLRFLLDHDVSNLLAVRLRADGHRCETASTIGMYDAQDDELVIYADDNNWVFITHDKELSRKRRRNTIGRIVRLHCSEPSAPNVLNRHLGDIAPILRRNQNVTIDVKPDSFTVHRGWRGWKDGDGH